MKRIILPMLAFILLVISCSMAINNNKNTYSKLWKEVEKAESKGLPQTAAKLLRELEELTIKQKDTLEQLCVSERLLDNLQQYNWKEANEYRPNHYTLRNEVYDNLDHFIEKYEGNPRVLMLYYEKFSREKRELDALAMLFKVKGEDYKALRKRCVDVLAKYKDKYYTDLIKGMIDGMDHSYLYSSSVGQIYPQEVTYEISSKNVGKLTIDLYRLKDNHIFTGDCTGLMSKIKQNGTLVSSAVFDSFKNEYNISETNKIKVDYQKEGNYVLVLSYGKETSYQAVCVSSVAGAVRSRDGRTEIYAANLRTGEPYKERKVDIFKNKSIYDASGIASLKPVSEANYIHDGFDAIEKKGIESKDSDKYVFRVSNGGDIYAPFLSFGFSSLGNAMSGDAAERYMYPSYELFTDRSLYQPGDTISFKAIYYKSNTVRGEVVSNQKMEISLKAPDSDEVIDSLILITNDFGSASGSFTLPEGCKNGMYRIYDGYRHLKSVRVETYKRPTFDITLNKNEEVYTFGDVLKQTGEVKSYAGYSVANALIQYEIYASPIVRYGNYIWFPSQEVMRGEVTSDDNGKFTINYLAERPKVDESNKEKNAQVTAMYSITVRVTDPQGETHESRKYLAVSDIPVVIEFALGEKQSHDGKPLINKDSTKQFTISLHNHDDVPYVSDGTYEILQEEKRVMGGKFSHDKPFNVDLKSLASGEYIIKATTKFRGKEIVKERKMIVFSPNDTVAPVQEDLFYYPIVEKGGIEFLIGTNEADLYLEMELLDGSRRLHRESLHLQKEMRKITLPYLESYNSSVNLFLYGFRNGKEISRTYKFTNPIEVTIPLVIDTFRDKTAPGSEETMTIKTAEGVEAMLSIYDVTTDRLGQNSFYFKPLQEVFHTWVPSVSNTLSGSYGYAVKERSKSRALGRAKNTTMFSLEDGVSADMVAQAPMAAMSSPMTADDVVMEEEAVALGADNGAGETDFSDVAIRENMSELIAFFPHLRSDAEGKIEVKYKTNDQLGTFRVLLMGYNKKLQTNQTEAQLVVSKPVMVAPNMPMFVRMGDKIVLKSKVVNLTEKQLKGTARIEFFDAETKEAIVVKGAKDIPVTLLAGAQGEVQWTITPPKVGQLGMKIMLKSDVGSDAEQNIITIEPEVITLTEAASFIMGQGKSHKDYEKELRKRIGAKNPIIEYAEYSSLDAAKEALSIAKKPETDNAINWISALYMNQMRALILAEEGKKDDTVLSEEFRNEAFAKIKILQDKDGGIMWFDGMNSSNMVTLFFLEKIHQLVESKAIVLNEDETKIIEKALDYIDGEIAYYYKQNSERDFSLVQYFSVRTLWLDYELSNGAESGLKKFISQTKEGWQRISIQDKAHVAQVFMRLKGSSYYKKEYDKRIDELVTSLKDYAVINPTIGCYFPNAVMPFRGLMHTEIYAHSQLLELFTNLGEKKMVRDLAQWLLLQKHNQAWQDCVATTDAVYAILSSGVKDLKFGAVYYTYTTEMKKVKEAANEITIRRSITRASDDSEVMEGDKLRVGDEIVVRYIIRNTENRSFVMMEAMRPACFYQKEERSGYSWGGYYREVKRSQTNYYFELLPEEYTTVEERFYVYQEGTFSSAIVKIESLYATEYRGHTGAMEIISRK